VCELSITIIESGSDHADLRSRFEAAYPKLTSARRTIVVKPVASGGALDTGEFLIDRLDDAAAHAHALIESGRAAVVKCCWSAGLSRNSRRSSTSA
jgi:hypothetical protein